MSCEPIYLDNNATTPLDPEVLDAMSPHFLAGGNAESRHALGRAARRACDNAREIVASILGALPSEVIFTSGGTEANNLAVFGLAGAESSPGHIVTSLIEHPAITEPVARLQAAGFTIDKMLVNRCGCVDASQFLDRFQSDTRFVTLMLANNETGALQPVAALANLAIERAIPVHTDAVQAVGRIPIHFHELGVTTLAASAHKFHGPTGIGVLLVRSGTRLGSRLFGGGQQHGRRPGTVPVALVVGMATALQRWHQEADARIKRWQALRDRLEAGLIANLGTDRIIRNGPADQYQRLPQTLNLGFLGLNGDTFLMQLDLAGIAASIGSACASGSTRLSPTLLAMHVPDECIQSSVRFSLGAQTTRAEVEQAIERITRIVLAQATLE